MPPHYWAEALSTATYLFNLHPTKTLQNRTPFHCLHGREPSYNHLRVFGCRCYPNLSTTTAHKLAPRSIECVFLGYPTNHKGYKCLDLQTNRVILSRHVIFDEDSFPFAKTTESTPSNYTFLEHDDPVFWSVPGTSTPGGAAPPSVAPAGAAIALTGQDGPPYAGPLPPAPAPTWEIIAPSAPSTSTLTVPIAPIDNAHAMRTRGKSGLRVLPWDILDLHVDTLSPIPKTYRGALRDPNWRNAMLDEFNALTANKTWTLVPRPTNANIVTGKWIFCHKLNSDGSLARYKARWVLRGFSQ